MDRRRDQQLQNEAGDDAADHAQIRKRLIGFEFSGGTLPRIKRRIRNGVTVTRERRSANPAERVSDHMRRSKAACPLAGFYLNRRMLDAETML